MIPNYLYNNNYKEGMPENLMKTKWNKRNHSQILIIENSEGNLGDVMITDNQIA